MPHNTRALVRLSCAILAGVSLATLSTSQPQAQYKLTVNRERLLNAQNEPQNWLMMNGDYSSQRYSKLTQINRENVKNLRMVWALALGGIAWIAWSAWSVGHVVTPAASVRPARRDRPNGCRRRTAVVWSACSRRAQR